jgi:hypothetical protein
MRGRRRTTIQDLRLAIDCLPHDTKVAMLRGISSHDIIVGAYTDGDGICPMLAAHRCGGRTSLISFAKAWDGLAFRGARVGRARRASERELLILRTHLEASLLEQDGPDPDFAGAVAEHRALLAHREEQALADEHAVRAREQRRAERSRRRAKPARERIRPGDPDRSRELGPREGWAWTRVVRRYDDYERALARLEAERDARRERELSCHH